MRKIREILRLHHEGLGTRAIARSVDASHSTVMDMLRRAEAKRIMEGKSHPEQGYRVCLGLIRLGDRYTPERLEAAAGRALACGARSYRSIRSILEHGLDQVTLEQAPPPLVHENLRGPEYYRDKGVPSC